MIISTSQNHMGVKLSAHYFKVFVTCIETESVVKL
jgi:hypothetical protein